MDPEAQNAKTSSQWQPPTDSIDEGGVSDDGGDFADACFDNSDDECGDTVAPQEQKPQAVGLQLVEAPKMAQRLDIGFARKAKRVDVKALKENLWSNLAPDGKKSSSTTFTSTTARLCSAQCCSHSCRRYVQGSGCLGCKVRRCFSAVLFYLLAASVQREEPQAGA